MNKDPNQTHISSRIESDDYENHDKIKAENNWIPIEDSLVEQEKQQSLSLIKMII